ncbi:hypothetical protein DL767_007954 [Monosporascus sp. MG133]|nr:hypothetical protein DL767_007954 [Monosporascus sp. MG133]
MGCGKALLGRPIHRQPGHAGSAIGMAQHVFRIRKQAEQLEKDRHIQNSETEVEQIGSAFRDLVDGVLRSGYARLDENLMRKLRVTARRVVLLANDKAEGSLDTIRQHQMRKSTTIMRQLDALSESLKQTFQTDFNNPVAEDAIKDLSARKSRQALTAGADPNRRTEIILNADVIEDYIMSRMVGYVDEDFM